MSEPGTEQRALADSVKRFMEERARMEAELLPLGDQTKKADAGKRRMGLLPFRALDEVGDVLTFGAAKYRPEGWRTVDNAVERYRDALVRHLSAYLQGEAVDPESKLRHLAHLATNALFLLELDQ